MSARPRSPSSELPTTMTAIAIDAYGGPDQLKLKPVPVPTLAPDEVLIEVAAAGLGVWDGKQRDGSAAAMEPGGGHRFPIVPGADGAGTIVAIGDDVRDFQVGDSVYGYSFLSPKGGFYAQYAAVPADAVARVPQGMDLVQASALAVVGITALRGLDDHLRVKDGERVVIVGASGGVGHIAIQLAKAMGAEVLAIVDSDDGATLALEAGADPVVNTKVDDLATALRVFASDGVDAVLAAVGGDGAAQAMAAIRPGGRAAWPHGVQPEPQPGPEVVATAFDGRPDRALLDKLDTLIERHAIRVHLARQFPMADAQEAHRALSHHHLGRMALVVK